jgi:hypothetical protein
MKIQFFRIVFIISVITLLNCNTTAISETVKQNIYNKDTIQVYGDIADSEFIVKFTNLIYEVDGKKAKIPIFQGNKGDATYKEFLEYCYNNNLLRKKYLEGGFIVTSEKGKLTSKFHEFLNFYKGNILKDVDINKPTSFEVYGNPQYEPEVHFVIYYDFKVNGVPFVLSVIAYSDGRIDNPDSLKSMFDIKLQETTNPPTFVYTFYENMSYKDF